MGNNTSVGEITRSSDTDLFRDKRRAARPPVCKRPRRASSVRRRASLKRQRSMRRNPPRCRAARDKKAARIARLEQELKLTEERKQLFAAAASGDVDRVQELIDSGMDVNYPDENQMTALHHAAMHARDKVIKALIERGANVNATDLKGGFSSLHWVVINADPQMGSTDHVDESIVALAKGGADVNCTDFNSPPHSTLQPKRETKSLWTA